MLVEIKTNHCVIQIIMLAKKTISKYDGCHVEFDVELRFHDI